MNDGFFVNQLNSNVVVPLSGIVDESLGHNEQLRKYGRLGNCIANNRRGIVRLGACLLLVVSLALSLFVLRFSYVGASIAASGLRASTSVLTSPWTAAEERHRRLLAQHAHNTTNANGLAIFGVVEPIGRVDSVQHIYLLACGIDKRNVDGRVVPRDVANGYLPWKPFSIPLAANFTLQHARQLVRHRRPEEHTCVCYVEYGLPHNIVYLPETDETLYGPHVEARSSERIKAASSCRFRNLLRRYVADPFAMSGVINYYYNSTLGNDVDDAVKRPDETNHTEIVEYSKSATVSYVDSKATQRRIVFGIPLFPCIEHCISLYNITRQLMCNEE